MALSWDWQAPETILTKNLFTASSLANIMNRQGLTMKDKNSAPEGR